MSGIVNLVINQMIIVLFIIYEDGHKSDRNMNMQDAYYVCNVMYSYMFLCMCLFYRHTYDLLFEVQVTVHCDKFV